MAHEWYIQHGGKQYGPLTSAKLKELAAQRKITPATSVRLGASGNWVPASRVQGLFAAQPASAPPRAPTPRPAASDLLDDELPPLASPPAPPPMASPLARVPLGAVAPVARAVEPEGSLAPKIIGAVGLIFGILALATCWLPMLGGAVAWTGIVVGGLGLVLGATALALSAMKKGSGLYLNIAGTSSAAVGLVLSVVLGITFGMFSKPPPQQVIVQRPAPPPPVEQPPPVVEAPKEPEPPPPPEIVWTPADQAIDSPPIRAKIAGVAIEKIRLESSDISTLKRGPPQPMLKIRVTIENTSADKIVDVPGWVGGAGGLLGGDLGAELAGSLLKDSKAGKSLQAVTAGATLVDSAGNNYAQTPSVQVFGAKLTLGEDNSLRPGNSSTKELVFPPPLEAPTIEFLRLELSPGGFSGSEPLRFQIPMAMISPR
jgi:hypothetical protein